MAFTCVTPSKPRKMSGTRPTSNSPQEDTAPLRRCGRPNVPVVVAVVAVTVLAATGLGVYFGVTRNATKSDPSPPASSNSDTSSSVTLESNDENPSPVDATPPGGSQVSTPITNAPAAVSNPVTTTIESPVASPVTPPVATPVANPISTPMTDPVGPTSSPVGSTPVPPPVNESPVASPLSTDDNPVQTPNSTSTACSTGLPNIPILPNPPCHESIECSYIMNALDPVFPPRTRALLNLPGTCQNWAREWMLSYSKDVMTFDVDRVRQRYTMALLYCEFSGDCWLEKGSWLSNLHECDWYNQGLNPCSRNEEYQIIRHYGQQIRGTLPPEISMISSLWEINLPDNLISGEIPSDFVKLSQLDTLALSFNLFEGPIPDFIWQFPDMTYLDLANNFFTGTIPDNIHLTEPFLKVLFLDNNDLSGSIPSTFGSFDWQRLYLAGNDFTGPVPADINSPRMEELRLHNNKLTGEFPAKSFAQYPGVSKLRQVTLYHNGDPDKPDAGTITGDFEVMCNLFYSGKLERLEVDDPTCSCCAGPP